jgi:site-specific DNA-methyltransferase (adenine-specific)
VFNGYPTEKPVAVGDVLVRQSSTAGDLVVDPFMGSGAFGVAALRSGRNFAGTDVGEEALRVARRRLVEVGGCAARLVTPESLAHADVVRTIDGGEAA